MKMKYIYWCIAVVLVIYLSFNVIAKYSFELITSHVLGTKVSIGEVSTKLLAGKLHMKNLKIHNPEKFKETYLFKAQEIDLAMNLSSLLSSLIVINDIKIISGVILYELDHELSIQDNIDVIKQNIKEYTRDKDREKSETKVIIHQLAIKNCQFKYNQNQPKTHTISLPNIEIKKIGVKENGINLEQAGWQILLEILLKSLS